jgi:oxygen-independent coproporphyrinogen-3 oxidase
LGGLLGAIADHFSLGRHAEVSVEANPGTVDAAALRELRAVGFNRLSLGVQSFNDAELRLLGRIHTGAQARQAVEDARAAGFDNLSIDLIRGLPGQSRKAWEANLQQAIALEPDHISAYGLSLEHGTPLADAVAAGQLPAPRSDDPEWVRVTVDLLGSAGYERYEISNFARPGYACRHNLTYWRNLPYVGVGAGAWSYQVEADRAVRYRNHPDIARYCAAALAGEDLVAERDVQDLRGAAGETLMVGLRLSEGVDLRVIQRRFGVDVRAGYGGLIGQLVEAGLMLDDGVRLRLTFQGLLVQSAVAARFLREH